jgi:hypothetical protein
MSVVLAALAVTALVLGAAVAGGSVLLAVVEVFAGS